MSNFLTTINLFNNDQIVANEKFLHDEQLIVNE